MTTAVRGSLTLVDPTTQPIIADFTGAPRLRDLTDKRVGIIDDSKVNAREFLHTVTELLDERFGVTGVKYHRKPSASKPADPAVISEMAEECDYVLVGIGD